MHNPLQGNLSELEKVLESIKGSNPSVEDLRVSGIGKTIGLLRKHSHAGVSDKANGLVRRWKTNLPKSPNSSSSSLQSSGGPEAASPLRRSSEPTVVVPGVQCMLFVDA